MIFRVLVSLFIATMLTSCATQAFVMKNGPTYEPTEETMQAFFVQGIGQSQTINAARVCGGADKVVRVDTHRSFLNGFLAVLTGGLYTPAQARVYCSR